MGRGLEWLGAVKGNRDEEARSEEPGRRRVRKREEKSVSTLRLYGTPSPDPHSALTFAGGLLDHSPSVPSICKVICSIPRCWFHQSARFFIRLDCRWLQSLISSFARRVSVLSILQSLQQRVL